MTTRTFVVRLRGAWIRSLVTGAAVIGLTLQAVAAVPASPLEKPNIIMIMTDDVGYWNVGAYSHGMMVPTPNIDRIAKEGILFTDHYAEPTCTPARAAFITGQMPIRTSDTRRSAESAGVSFRSVR